MEAQIQQKQCQNCRKLFPSDKIDLHEAYCFRNIKKCPKCDKMIDIKELDAHNLQDHTNKVCELCKSSMPFQLFANHPEKCPKRSVFCEYCENDYVFVEIEKHKQACGGRTRACQICQKFIAIREIAQHQNRCQKRAEQRRNQISQDVARNHNRNDNRPSSRQRQRQISQNNLRQKRQTSLNRNQIVIPKNNKIKPSHMIGPEIIKPVIDPVPISIRLAMKMKQQQRVPLQSKN